MKLNWRKIILIIVCAECLFIYWNGLSTMNFRKQQTTHIAPTLQPQVPLTQLQPRIQDIKKIDSDLHKKENAS